MNTILEAVAQHACRTPDACALSGESGRVTYRDLQHAITSGVLPQDTGKDGPVAIAVDNGPAWAIVDLALMAARRPCVPLPSFFSDAQQAHALNDAGAQ